MDQNFTFPDFQDTPSAKTEEQSVPYASVTERFAALLIDYALIFIVFGFICSAVLSLIGKRYDENFVLGNFIFINIVFILYETFLSCGDRMTLGKALVGIGVMRSDLQGPLPWYRAFVRAIGYYISAGFLLCGFLWAFIDNKHRAWHDFLSGSVVVEVRQRSALEKALVRGLGGLIIAVFFGIFYFQSFGGTSWRQKYKVRQAEKMLQKVAVLEEGHFRRYGYYTNDLLRLALLSGDPVQFQRDMQKNLQPKGFYIGATQYTYKITAFATDKKKTQVVWPKN